MAGRVVSWQEEVWEIHLRAIKKSGIRPGTDEDTRFLALALSGEVGELNNIIKKAWRGDFAIEEMIGDIELELADIQIYLELLTRSMRLDLTDAVHAKLPEIRKKFPRTRDEKRAGSDARFDQSRK